ncbi:uncharacterized protein LOC111112592 [Crassostrea virginica]
MTTSVKILTWLLLLRNCRSDDTDIRTMDRRLLLTDPNTLLNHIEALQQEMTSLKSQVNSLNTEVTALNTKVTSQQTEISILQNQLKTAYTEGTGSVYTVWGKKSCPAVNGTTTVYSGITGGGMFDQKGNGDTTLCLPHDPEKLPADFPTHVLPEPYVAHVFGAEYQFGYGKIDFVDDVPCAVCHAQTSASVLMVPAKRTCPDDWKMQYSGSLSAEASTYSGSDYICVAWNAEYFEGTRAVDANGRLLYPVKAKCGSLPCPPYTENQYVSCVVCTK